MGQLKLTIYCLLLVRCIPISKTEDLLPELQGRLPIRVELEALISEDFKKFKRAG